MMPSSNTPSPKNVVATREAPSMRKASALPTASALPSPRMGLEPIMPTERSVRCTDPPRPREQPSSRP
jgi:hypothetical protein